MTKLALNENPELAQTSAAAIDQLSSVLASYNETTSRLHNSYQQLNKEVARLRLELREKNEQLERKSRLAALGEMAAGMAHEIRNPLGGLQLYASLLDRELSGQNEARQWVEKMSRGIGTLDAIVSDILAFTQDQSCAKTEVNLSALLSEVLDYVRPRIESRPVSINHDDVDRELIVCVDFNMMKRILLNLILNAVEAVEAAGEQGCVTVSACCCRDKSNFNTRICVADTGGGICPEQMNKIFNPFFTTKDTGTGLGLAIVHRLVECQGGIITAAHNQPQGAKFTILLP
ncbi:MAG: hypothetical protein KAJ52_09550 [Sedimentisphaerales bacterium]|nr:hypothetical protein [Sedimentisphaerales bacterium]